MKHDVTTCTCPSCTIERAYERKAQQATRARRFEEASQQETVWMKAEQQACRRGDHQEAAACHAWRWHWLGVMQRIAEMG